MKTTPVSVSSVSNGRVTTGAFKIEPRRRRAASTPHPPKTPSPPPRLPPPPRASRGTTPTLSSAAGTPSCRTEARTPRRPAPSSTPGNEPIARTRVSRRRASVARRPEGDARRRSRRPRAPSDLPRRGGPAGCYPGSRAARRSRSPRISRWGARPRGSPPLSRSSGSITPSASTPSRRARSSRHSRASSVAQPPPGDANLVPSRPLVVVLGPASDSNGVGSMNIFNVSSSRVVQVRVVLLAFLSSVCSSATAGARPREARSAGARRGSASGPRLFSGIPSRGHQKFCNANARVRGCHRLERSSCGTSRRSTISSQRTPPSAAATSIVPSVRSAIGFSAKKIGPPSDPTPPPPPTRARRCRRPDGRRRRRVGGRDGSVRSSRRFGFGRRRDRGRVRGGRYSAPALAPASSSAVSSRPEHSHHVAGPVGLGLGDAGEDGRGLLRARGRRTRRGVGRREGGEDGAGGGGGGGGEAAPRPAALFPVVAPLDHRRVDVERLRDSKYSESLLDAGSCD